MFKYYQLISTGHSTLGQTEREASIGGRSNLYSVYGLPDIETANLQRAY